MSIAARTAGFRRGSGRQPGVNGRPSCRGRPPMPTISRFYGIIIEMHWNEHVPPHFHATAAGVTAFFAIEDGKILAGTLPRRAVLLVREWSAVHRDALLENWDLCRKRTPPR